MKKVFIMIFIAAGIIACKSDDKKTTGTEITKDTLTTSTDPVITTPALPDTTNFTSIKWLDSTYVDLGTRKEGKEVEIKFRFRNTGTQNLVIENVSAQCGCTIPETPKEPFAPGEEGVIKAKFNGAGHDETRKQVYVKANIKPYGADTLTFRAMLVK